MNRFSPITPNYLSPQAANLAYWLPLMGEESITISQNHFIDKISGNQGELVHPEVMSWVEADGRRGLYLPDSNEPSISPYGQLTANAPANLNISGEIAISAWIYPTVLPSGVNDGIAIGGGGASSTFALGWGMWLDDVSGVKQIKVGRWNAGATHVVASWTYDSTIAANKWTHALGGWKGGEWRLLVNGVLRDTTADATGATGIPSGGVPRFGGIYVAGGTGTIWNFRGALSDLRVYKKYPGDSLAAHMYAPQTQYDLFRIPVSQMPWLVPPPAPAPITGAGAAVIGDVTVSGAGTVLVQGAGTSTVGDITGASTGKTLVQGAGASTIADITGSAAGTVLVQGAGSATIADLTGSGAGTVLVQGAGSAAVDDITGSGTGTVGSSPITGSGAATIADITGTGAGTVLIQGAGSAAIGDITGSGAGKTLVQGSGSATIANIIGTGTGVVGSTPITGEGAATIGDIVGSGAGTVLVQGEGAAAIADITGSASGTTLVQGEGAATIGDITGTGAGHVGSGASLGGLQWWVSRNTGVTISEEAQAALMFYEARETALTFVESEA
jgi:hypothetical protein